MKLLEYQAKAILCKAGLPVPASQRVTSPEQVADALKKLGTSVGVIKAQVYTGGRGKAGGVKLFKSVNEAKRMAKEIIGMTLVTHQTGPEGVKVESVILEEASEIARELYVAFLIDRKKSKVAAMISPEGGTDIEEVAVQTPEKILNIYLEIGTPISDDDCKSAAAFLSLEGDLADQLADVLNKLFTVFQAKDGNLLEINPLVVTGDNKLALVDCKLAIDENALFRQKDIDGDPNAEKSDAEIEAAKYGLNYIKLEGNIGCMVNGAGLAMATMDIILAKGAQPANFLDVGGSATEEAIAKAFNIITSDPNVKAILVNIFGGIMKCDVIASGVLSALRATGLKVPLIVRLEGTNVEKGREIINSSGLEITLAENMADGAEKAAAAIV